MTLDIRIYYPQASPPPVVAQPYRTFRVPNEGSFVQIRHDWETDRWNFKPRAYSIEDWNQNKNPDGAFPDTFPFFTKTLIQGEVRKVTHMPLTAPWQYLWFDLLKKACYNKIPEAELKERWRIITMHGRAFTDFVAVQQGYADYVLGLNLGAEPIRQKFLGLGGNICKILGTDGAYYLVEALDLSKAPPALDDVWGKWWLIHWASQSTIHRYSSGWRITDWSWLNWEGVGYGVPYMFISNSNPVSIPKVWCKPIANGAMYSPYIP